MNKKRVIGIVSIAVIATAAYFLFHKKKKIKIDPSEKVASTSLKKGIEAFKNKKSLTNPPEDEF